MSEPTRGPWQLRYLLIKNDVPEPGVLLSLTSNGVGNVVTVVHDIQPDKQTVKLDVISVCIIDSLHYSGFLCP